MDEYMEFEETLKCSGLKITSGRRAIMEVLAENDQPMTAETLFLRLKEKQININLSTVYRNLEALEQVNLITKISIMDDDSNLYEYNGGGHRHYLVCLKCKKIITVRHCPLSNYEKEVEDETSFTVLGHKLYLYGYCSSCRFKMAEA